MKSKDLKALLLALGISASSMLLTGCNEKEDSVLFNVILDDVKDSTCTDEILNLDEPIKELIMNGASSIDIRKNALQREYRPLVVDGIKKVVAGVTTLEELNRKLRVF